MKKVGPKDEKTIFMTLRKETEKKKGKKKGYFVSKIVLTGCEKKCFSDRRKLFANFLSSQEQFIQTAKGQNNF